MDASTECQLAKLLAGTLPEEERRVLIARLAHDEAAREILSMAHYALEAETHVTALQAESTPPHSKAA